MKTVLALIVIGLSMGVIGFFIGRILASRNINERFKKLLDEYKSNVEKTQPKLAIKDRLTYTRELLELIDTLVGVELTNAKKFEILKPDQSELDFDTVLNQVSENVYNAIKPEIINNTESIVTSEYLAGYIVDRTFVIYFNYLAQKKQR